MKSLASKYRPNIFEEVIGQEAPIEILTNQITSGTLKQGYLFVGGAGTGKTTVARILARTVNGSLDGVIEIDAASNNGVDNVREIRENCKFKPINTKYKIYIIDECHMLSTGAWNALLKTLEEPPEYCIFILCTTDPQKIPATIISRVQRFDFKRVPQALIVNRLKFIIDAECTEMEATYEVEDDALEYIAKLSEGGVRDSISTLDTCLEHGEGKLTLKAVTDILGTVPTEDYFDLTYFLIDNSMSDLICLIERLHEAGKDLKKVISGYSEFLVDLLKYVELENFNYIKIPSSFNGEIEELCEERGIGKSLRSILNMTIKLSADIKYVENPRTMIEGGFMLWEN